MPSHVIITPRFLGNLYRFLLLLHNRPLVWRRHVAVGTFVSGPPCLVCCSVRGFVCLDFWFGIQLVQIRSMLGGDGQVGGGSFLSFFFL